jgi:hypothetical protein
MCLLEFSPDHISDRQKFNTGDTDEVRSLIGELSRLPLIIFKQNHSTSATDPQMDGGLVPKDY